MSNFRRRLMQSLNGILTKISGKLPLLLKNAKNKELKNYTIYGNCTQETTPTIDTPVEVKETGDLTNNILVNNLVPGATGTIAGVNYTVNKDLSIYLKGKTTGTFSLRLAGEWNNPNTILIFRAGKTYVLAGKSGNFYTSLYKTAVDGSTSQYTNTLTANPRIITPAEDINIGDIFIYCAASSVGTEIDDTIYPLCIEGSYSEVPEYEPYGKYKIPVQITRHNMCNNKFLKTTINFSTGVETSNNNFTSLKEYIEIEAESTYELWRSSYDTTLGLRFYDENKNYLGSLGIKTQKYTLDISNGLYKKAKFLRWTVASTKEIQYIFVKNKIQGNYDDYFNGCIEKIYLDSPILKIGEVSDYIDFKSQKIHRKNYKSKIANTGSYNILGTTASPNRLVIHNGLYTNKRAKGSTSQLCKYIPCVNWASGKELGFYVSVRAIYINNTNCTTVDEYKAWLDSLEDLMFYYQLADEYVYEEDIIMPKITLFNGDCTFDVITEIKPSKAEVEYWR